VQSIAASIGKDEYMRRMIARMRGRERAGEWRQLRSENRPIYNVRATNGDMYVSHGDRNAGECMAASNLDVRMAKDV